MYFRCWTWNAFDSNFASYSMAMHNFNSFNYNRNKENIRKIGGKKYDYCSEKSSKTFKRNCKVYFRNKKYIILKRVQHLDSLKILYYICVTIIAFIKFIDII